MKIEDSNGQISRYGPAMAAVFRGLIPGKRAGGTAEGIGRSAFHTEPAFNVSSPRITPTFHNAVPRNSA